MFALLKKHWEELQGSRPGRRFQDRYKRSQESKDSKGVGRIFRLLLAIAAVGIGIVLTVFPGPAIVFFFLGGSLLASESLAIARFMDWCELKFRAIYKRGQRLWKKMPFVARAAATIVIVSSGIASTYLCYRLMKQ
jgi:hypothetical protein